MKWFENIINKQRSADKNSANNKNIAENIRVKDKHSAIDLKKKHKNKRIIK